MNPTREETRLRLATVWLFFALIFCVGSLKLSAAEEVPDRTAMAVEALSRLQGIDVNQNPKIKETVLRVLEKTRGTANFVKLVRQFKLTDQDAGLLEVAVQNSASETGVEAIRLDGTKVRLDTAKGAIAAIDFEAEINAGAGELYWLASAKSLGI